MSKITLLDGGMGQELIRRAGGVATPLWATQALLDDPAIVADVHRAYTDAGATVATTNSYALHRDRLRGGESNHYAGEGVELPNLEGELQRLLQAACDATDVARSKGRVAGSIGPLGASYRADLNPPRDKAIALYGEIAALLAPRVDVVLFETIATIEAGETCLAAGRQTDRPVWLSYTIDDEDGTVLRSGERLADAVAAVPGADAVLVNCSAPEALPAAMAVLKDAGVPFGGYANGFKQITKAFIAGGTTADDLSAREDITPAVYAEHVMNWVAAGATIVGGCCEVGPAHIAAIADRLNAAGHEIV